MSVTLCIKWSMGMLIMPHHWNIFALQWSFADWWSS